ncbi:MAG: peptidyl-prolyl cis-trans isomerase [Lutimonas sp.]
MRAVFLILFVTLFIGCKKEMPIENAVARIDDKFLSIEEFKASLPSNYTKDDSIQLRSSIINNWATNELLLDKAKLNIGDDQKEIEKLVDNYRKELLIERYKEALLNKLLDTIVTESDLESFYLANKDIYRLSEDLVRLKFIMFDKNLKNADEFEKLFKSESKEDLTELNDRKLELKMFSLNDSIWVSYKLVSERLPFLEEINKLKKDTFLKKEDSLGVYLVALKDILYINETAPRSYVEPTVKKMILHKRKLDLFRDIEKSLLSEAVKSKKFETY